MNFNQWIRLIVSRSTKAIKPDHADYIQSPRIDHDLMERIRAARIAKGWAV